jgi:hypothetical protein
MRALTVVNEVPNSCKNKIETYIQNRHLTAPVRATNETRAGREASAGGWAGLGYFFSSRFAHRAAAAPFARSRHSGRRS